MAHTIKELADQFDLDKLLPRPTRSERCPLGDHLLGSEPREYDKQLVCEDCYFSKLSDLIDEHPIGHPGGRRRPSPNDLK